LDIDVVVIPFLLGFITRKICGGLGRKDSDWKVMPFVVNAANNDEYLHRFLLFQVQPASEAVSLFETASPAASDMVALDAAFLPIVVAYQNDGHPSIRVNVDNLSVRRGSYRVRDRLAAFGPDFYKFANLDGLPRDDPHRFVPPIQSASRCVCPVLSR
jgi:hypothetical protein